MIAFGGGSIANIRKHHQNILNLSFSTTKVVVSANNFFVNLFVTEHIGMFIAEIINIYLFL